MTIMQDDPAPSSNNLYILHGVILKIDKSDSDVQISQLNKKYFRAPNNYWNVRLHSKEMLVSVM